MKMLMQKAIKKNKKQHYLFNLDGEDILLENKNKNSIKQMKI